MHRFLHHEQPQPCDGIGLPRLPCVWLERGRRLKPRLNCSQRRKEGFATVSQQSSQPAPSSSALQSKSSQEITAGSSLCCPTTGSLGPKFLRTAANHRSKVKGEEKPLWSALDPSSVERGQERSLWEPARLLYDVKSSWSAAAPAGGLLHNQQQSAASSPPRASCLRRLFRVGAFRPSKPWLASPHQPPAVPAPLAAAAADSTAPASFSEWQFCTPGF